MILSAAGIARIPMQLYEGRMSDGGWQVALRWVFCRPRLLFVGAGSILVLPVTGDGRYMNMYRAVGSWYCKEVGKRRGKNLFEKN